MKLMVVTILIISIILCSYAYALGIATDYGSEVVNIPLNQKTAFFSFRLQNMEDEETTVMIDVNSEKNITKLLNESKYTLAPVTRGSEFLIELTTPEDAKEGDVYNVTISIKQVSKQEGQVKVGQGIGKKFQVKIEGNESPFYSPLKREESRKIINETENSSSPTSFAIVKENNVDFSIIFAVLIILTVLIAVYLYRRRSM